MWYGCRGWRSTLDPDHPSVPPSPVEVVPRDCPGSPQHQHSPTTSQVRRRRRHRRPVTSRQLVRWPAPNQADKTARNTNKSTDQSSIQLIIEKSASRILRERQTDNSEVDKITVKTRSKIELKLRRYFTLWINAAKHSKAEIIIQRQWRILISGISDRNSQLLCVRFKYSTASCKLDIDIWPFLSFIQLTLTLTLIQPRSTWMHWATLQCQACLLTAAASTSSQVSPVLHRSFWTVPLQFVLGRPGPLLKSRTSQHSACCGIHWRSICIRWPSECSLLSMRWPGWHFELCTVRCRLTVYSHCCHA